MINLQQMENDQYREELRIKLGDDKYRRVVVKQLLDEHQNGIYSYCVGWLDRAYGEDVAQEVFISAWEKLLDYRGDSALKTWLFGIAKNACRKCWRDRGRHQDKITNSSAVIQDNVHGVAPVSPEDELIDDEGQVEENENNTRLETCIKKLLEKEQRLIRLQYIKQKKIAEISEFFEEKPDTLYKRSERALEKLKKCMNYES